MWRILQLLQYCGQFVFYKARGERQATFDVVYAAVEKMGGVYVKLLQFLSLRADLFPDQAKMRFLTFYDQVPVQEIDVHRILRAELGEDVLNRFSKIETQPFASGTFGQVYKATLVEGGEVVIKIKRPHLRRGLRIDFGVIRVLGWLFDLLYYQQFVDVPSLIREFRKTTYAELDYAAEVSNALYLYEQYKDHETLLIPFTYKPLCTQQVIVQDFVGGVSLTDLIRMRAMGKNPKDWLSEHYKTDMHYIIKRVSYDSMWQIFSLERFYSDPHPGNIKILPNNQYAFIDFGIMAESPPNKRDYFQIIDYFSQGADEFDANGLGQQLLSIGTHYLIKCLKTYDRVVVESDESIREKVQGRYGELIEGWREQFRRLEVEQVENYTQVWLDLFSLGERFNMKMPKGLFAGLRSAALIKEFTFFLDPDFHPMNQVFKEIVRDIDGQKLLNLDDLDVGGVGIEEAVETVSDWFAGLAEADLLLYQDITRLSI